jgi:hypothetical protein
MVHMSRYTFTAALYAAAIMAANENCSAVLGWPNLGVRYFAAGSIGRRFPSVACRRRVFCAAGRGGDPADLDAARGLFGLGKVVLHLQT